MGSRMWTQMHCQDQIIEPTKKEKAEYQADNEVGELKITYATDLEGDPEKKS